MKLPHNEHQTILPIADSIRSVLEHVPIQVELAASLGFFDDEESYGGLTVFEVSKYYDEFYEDCAKAISMDIGPAIYQGRLPDSMGWSEKLGIEPCFDQVHVWEKGDKHVYLVSIWEDKDCPIVISLGAHCISQTPAKQSPYAHPSDLGAAASKRSIGTTGRVHPRVAVSLRNTFFIDDEGALWAWGYNDNGELGDGTTLRRFTPARIGSGFVCVSAHLSNFAIKADGTLWGWKNTPYGTLGNGTVSESNARRLSLELVGNDYAQVAAGCSHTVAIKNDGALWTWGSNSCGRLGDGKGTDSTVPVQIGCGYAQIAAGTFHSVGVRTDGTMWGWGLNSAGALGETLERNCLVPVLMGQDFVHVAVGDNHTVAIRKDGTLWTWGDNHYGQLGVQRGRYVETANGPEFVKGTDSSSTPILIGSDFVQVSASEGTTMAIKADGSLWGWGYNSTGQLGNGSTNWPAIPACLGSDYVEVAAGPFHSAAIKRDGTLWTWGSNNEGQLGDGTTTNRLSPVQIDVSSPTSSSD